MLVAFIVFPLVGIAAPYLSKEAGFGVVVAYAVIIEWAAGVFGWRFSNERKRTSTKQD